MNKKLIVIVVSLILVVCLLGAGVVFLIEKGNNLSADDDSSADEVITPANWLTIDSVSELESLAEKEGKTIEYGPEDIYVSDLPFAEGTASYSYHFNTDNEIVGLNVGMVLVSSVESGDAFVMEEVSAQDLYDRVRVVIGWISNTLNVNIGNKFYIFSENGDILPVEENSSYEQLLNGTASLELRILDVDESVWILNIEMIQGYNIVSCIFEHCMADSEEAKIPCDVVIQQ